MITRREFEKLCPGGDREKLLKLLTDKKNYAFSQKDLRQKFGWSKSKISKIFHELEFKKEVLIARNGREKFICLKVKKGGD